MNNELTPHIMYRDNGNVFAKGQKNSKGQREGIWEIFWENGNIQWRIPYKEDERDGIVEWFYPNGNMHWRISYKDDRKDGIEECFDERGTSQKPAIEKTEN
jgi:antitoxin component YwqK of YwqJK toxin-antitoxin module